MKDRNSTIIEMFEKGMSLTKIGSELGISRSAVAGVIHRARMGGKKVAVLFQKDGSPMPKKPVAKKSIHIVEHKNQRSKIGRTATLPLIESNLPYVNDIIFNAMPFGVKGVTIMLLKSSSCRYILPNKYENQTLYCGDSVYNRSYCKDHFNLCYSKVSDVKAGYRVKRYLRTG